MVIRKFRWLIIVTFFLTGCKTYLNEVGIKEIITGKVPAYKLSDEAICKVLQRVDLPSVVKEMNNRGLNCRKSAQPLALWEPPKLEENFVTEKEYQEKYNVQIPDYKIHIKKSIYGTPEQSLKYYKFYNLNFEEQLSTLDWRQSYCDEWFPDLQWIDVVGTKGLDGSISWLPNTERDSFVICQHMMQRLALRGLFSSEHSQTFQNIIEKWITNDAPKKVDEGNFLYVFWMNGIFNGVELLHQNFNWDEKQYSAYANWLRTRTLEFYPIETKNKSSSSRCLSIIRKGSDRSDECQNMAAITAQATLRAGIWLGDSELIDQAFLTFHKYMTGIREDGSNISDSSRTCVAANYNIWASAFMDDFVYLWSIIGDPLWNHSSLDMGTPSEAVKYSLSLIDNPELINPYTLVGGNYINCSPNINDREQTDLAARYPKIFFAPYFFQNRNIPPAEFVGTINYLDSDDYLYDGANSEISYLYHHPGEARKAENLYISLKGKKIRDTTDLKDYGLKNKKRGLLKKYDTVLQLYALHKNDEYEYPVFIGIEGEIISIDIFLPRFSYKSKDAWNPDKKKLEVCNKEFVTDEAIIINVNQIESKKSEIKCILDSFTFEERNIFIKSYEEFINNAKNIFENSHKESKDENEKKLLNNSLNMIILNKSSISLN